MKKEEKKDEFHKAFFEDIIGIYRRLNTTTTQDIMLNNGTLNLDEDCKLIRMTVILRVILFNDMLLLMQWGQISSEFEMLNNDLYIAVYSQSAVFLFQKSSQTVLHELIRELRIR